MIPNLFVNDVNIEKVNSFIYLGITLGENIDITRKPHIAAIVNKLSK